MKVYLIPEDRREGNPIPVGDYDIHLTPKGGNASARMAEDQVEKSSKTCPVRESWNSPKAKFFRRRYRYTIRGLIGAIILALMFLNLGFARTIGVILLLVIGFLVGGVLDKNPVVLRLLKRLR